MEKVDQVKQNARKNLQNRKRNRDNINLPALIAKQRIEGNPVIRSLAKDLHCSPLDVVEYAMESVGAPRK